MSNIRDNKFDFDALKYFRGVQSEKILNIIGANKIDKKLANDHLDALIANGIINMNNDSDISFVLEARQKIEGENKMDQAIIKLLIEILTNKDLQAAVQPHLLKIELGLDDIKNALIEKIKGL